MLDREIKFNSMENEITVSGSVLSLSAFAAQMCHCRQMFEPRLAGLEEGEDTGKKEED